MGSFHLRLIMLMISTQLVILELWKYHADQLERRLT